MVLTSPQFLFLIENEQNARTRASRQLRTGFEALVFPVERTARSQRLLRLAASGALRRQLDTEVGRMIDDPRFSRFVREFTSQWLSLDKFQVLEPDRKRFPKLTRDIRSQLRQEPIQFVQYLIRNNLPVRNLIASDFVVVNEAVANYYDLADKNESGFQFVPHRTAGENWVGADAAGDHGWACRTDGNRTR